MKNLFLLTLVILFASCSSDECDEVADYTLTDFERSFIPFEESTVLIYKNGAEELFGGTATGKEVEIINLYSSENCEREQLERQQNNIFIPLYNLDLNVNVQKYNEDKPSFYIVIDELFYNLSCDNFSEFQDVLTDYSSDGFDFKNVFVFEHCDEEEITIQTIVYSTTNGVEFIKFVNGSFLQLQS